MEEFWVNFALTPVADEKAGIRIAVERYHRAKIKSSKTHYAQISVDFKIENDYSIAVNELCKSISKMGILIGSNYGHQLKKTKCYYSVIIAEIEDKRFYD
jgi:hypothetical protein